MQRSSERSGGGGGRGGRWWCEGYWGSFQIAITARQLSVMGRRRLPPLLSSGLRAAVRAEACGGRHRQGGNTPLGRNGSSSLLSAKQSAVDIRATNNTDFHPAALHITSTLEAFFFFFPYCDGGRSCFLFFIRDGKNWASLKPFLLFLFKKKKKNGEKSEVLCPGIGSNDRVVPGGDFIILPLDQWEALYISVCWRGLSNTTKISMLYEMQQSVCLLHRAPSPSPPPRSTHNWLRWFSVSEAKQSLSCCIHA